MEKEDQQLSAIFSPVEVPAGFSERVLKAIARAKIMRARRRAVLFLSALVGSFVGLSATVPLLGTSFSQSGFYQYFSLVFSDTGYLTMYWSDLLLSLLETLPVLSLVIFFGLILLMVESMRFLTGELRTMRRGWNYKF